MTNLQALCLLSILALANMFVKISGSSSIHPELTGPDMAYLNSRVVFNCSTPNYPLPVTYELIRDSGVRIDVRMNLQRDQPALFSLKVSATSEGSYHCKATTKRSTGVSNSIRLSVVTPASNTRVTSEPFPPVAYEGSRVILSCDVAKGSHLSYTWFFNKQEVTSSVSPFFHLTGNKLVMEMVTPEHAGWYYCEAWSIVQGNKRVSSSTVVQVTVKVYISKPKISFSISKVGASYFGNVTCWSSRGSPPVNFSLSLDGKEVGSETANEYLSAWFPVTMTPGMDMGVAQCWVKTELQELMSEPLTLEVVPVGGDMKVKVEYLYRADSTLAATRLHCQVSRGTFPYISWLLNDSVLPSKMHVDSYIQPGLPHYVLTNLSRTLILSELGQENTGYYRCRARDSYNDSGPWVESAAVLVPVTDRIWNCLPQAPSSTEIQSHALLATIEVITVVFCCFLLLMLAAGGVCVYRMFDHQQALTHTAVINSDEVPQSAPTFQSGGRPNTSSTDCDTQDQIEEITV